MAKYETFYTCPQCGQLVSKETRICDCGYVFKHHVSLNLVIPSALIFILLLLGVTDISYNLGYDSGNSESSKANLTVQYSEDSDYNDGYQDAKSEYYDKGYSDGEDAGYHAGYSDGMTDITVAGSYTENQRNQYAQDRVDAIIKEIFAGQTDPFTGNPVDSEADYRAYIKAYNDHLNNSQ